MWDGITRMIGYRTPFELTMEILKAFNTLDGMQISEMILQVRMDPKTARTRIDSMVDSEILQFQEKENNSGSISKYYRLTDHGVSLLNAISKVHILANSHGVRL